MKQTLKITLSAFLATAALIKGAEAFAEPVTGQNVAIVSTAGLDLSTAADRATLDHRLVTAVYEVCGTPSDADLVGKNHTIACRREVLAEARHASAQLASRGTSIRIGAAR